MAIVQTLHERATSNKSQINYHLYQHTRHNHIVGAMIFDYEATAFVFHFRFRPHAHLLLFRFVRVNFASDIAVNAQEQAEIFAWQHCFELIGAHKRAFDENRAVASQQRSTRLVHSIASKKHLSNNINT